MSEQTTTEQDGISGEQTQLAPDDLSDSELENVSGGQAEWDGGDMDIQQKGGGNGTAPLTSNPPR